MRWEKKKSKSALRTFGDSQDSNRCILTTNSNIRQSNTTYIHAYTHIHTNFNRKIGNSCSPNPFSFFFLNSLLCAVFQVSCSGCGWVIADGKWIEVFMVILGADPKSCLRVVSFACYFHRPPADEKGALWSHAEDNEALRWKKPESLKYHWEENK